MDKGKVGGLVVGLVLISLAYASAQLIPIFGDVAVILTGVIVMAAGALLFYTNGTSEGNIWFRSKFLRDNSGMAVFIEAGKFQRHVPCDYSKDSLTYDGQLYRIKKEYILMRSGIAYVYFIAGIGENIDPLNLDFMKPLGDNKVVTAWMFQNMALWRAIAFNQVQNLMWMAIIGLGVLMIIGFAFIYFGGIDPINQNIVKMTANIISHLPTPTPTPGAIPVA
jgi:hypothetical protein